MVRYQYLTPAEITDEWSNLEILTPVLPPLQGCYTAGKRYVVENSSLILGFGFTLLILMVSEG